MQTLNSRTRYKTMKDMVGHSDSILYLNSHSFLQQYLQGLQNTRFSSAHVSFSNTDLIAGHKQVLRDSKQLKSYKNIQEKQRTFGNCKTH